MELEEAIKTVRKFNQENRYRDCGKINNSIDMALQALDDYKNGNVVSLKLLENFYLVNKDKNKQMTLANKELFKDYIPKEKVKDKIGKLDKEYNEILSDYGNIDTDITFNIPNKNVRKQLDELVIKIVTLQELLEEK